jgi:hypothetical protein
VDEDPGEVAVDELVHDHPPAGGVAVVVQDALHSEQGEQLPDQRQERGPGELEAQRTRGVRDHHEVGVSLRQTFRGGAEHALQRGIGYPRRALAEVLGAFLEAEQPLFCHVVVDPAVGEREHGGSVPSAGEAERAGQHGPRGERPGQVRRGLDGGTERQRGSGPDPEAEAVDEIAAEVHVVPAVKVAGAEHMVDVGGQV